ncbi:MAG: hypothetical protein E6H10_11300 [Bacteroidetes bacterium]|nr:MAG: hypothetical protein E6H10_11300 [Bacteroidota bacterium]
MRLEIAAHSLIIQLEKSIKEIAIETGFTSAATFARAFKHYFDISGEKLRALTAQQRMALYKKGSHKQQLLDADRMSTMSKTRKHHRTLESKKLPRFRVFLHLLRLTFLILRTLS